MLVRQNVAATRALTEAAATCRIRRFVLVSSLSVYASAITSSAVGTRREMSHRASA